MQLCMQCFNAAGRQLLAYVYVLRDEIDRPGIEFSTTVSNCQHSTQMYRSLACVRVHTELTDASKSETVSSVQFTSSEVDFMQLSSTTCIDLNKKFGCLVVSSLHVTDNNSLYVNLQPCFSINMPVFSDFFSDCASRRRRNDWCKSNAGVQKMHSCCSRSLEMTCRNCRNLTRNR